MKRSFAAEVDKVLRLVIHSIYTNKDIFLRELISNASDACDKLRYQLLQSESSDAHDRALKIGVIINKENHTLTVYDNGIGMDEDDLVHSLGTIAKSGTEQFLAEHAENKEQLELIGRFGVGFYSAFMVASAVTVYTRKFGMRTTFKWESDGHSGYTLSEAEQDKCMDESGTVIELKITPECLDFLEKYKIQHIIKTYSDHISFPIELQDAEGVSEIVNSSSALWLKKPSSISKETYSEFYHHISHMPDEPWLTMHNSVEGNITYTNLLFIPTNKPFDLFRPQPKSKVKLYVKRVFITDEGVNLVPPYMRFICGVIDSDDLPLNISRETLQNNLVVAKIRKSVVKKVLSTLQKKVIDDLPEYEKFWMNFGEVLKEGLCEGAFEEKELLLDVCRFKTLNSSEETLGLQDYVVNMVDGQEEIYYITGNDPLILKNHPQLQKLKKLGVDVILLSDHVDDFWVNVVNQYKNYSLKSVLSCSIDLKKIEGDAEDKQKKENYSAQNEDGEKIILYIKSVLMDKVRDVKASTKLVEHPVCLSLPEGAMNIRMEKMLIEQKQLNKRSSKILEVNVTHPLMLKLAEYISGDVIKAEVMVHVLFGQACILEGEPLDNPYLLVEQINNLISS